MTKPKTSKTMHVIGILAFILSFISVYYFSKNLDHIEPLMKSYGMFAPVVIILLYGILSITPIPTDPLTVACGALFGPWWGSLISWAGNTFAALIEYYLGKGVGTLADFESKRKDLPWGLGKYPVDSPWFLILGRMVPGFGSKIVSVLGGIYSVNLWLYFWTAGVANIVGSVIYAMGGFGLLNFFMHFGQ